MKRTAHLPPPSLAPAFAWAGLCAAIAIIAVVCSAAYMAPVNYVELEVSERGIPEFAFMAAE